MPKKNKKLCKNCFSHMSGKKCSACGYTDKQRDGSGLFLQRGTKLNGSFIIGGVIGSGGFGVTYMAYDLKTEKAVAIKEYFPKTISARKSDGSVCPIDKNNEKIFFRGVEKFYREAEYVFQFNGNSNIVGIFDYFYANNTAYLVMEYLSGITLENYIKNYGTLSEAQTVYIAERLSMALLIIHSAQILHRDISPDNIMLCKDGRIKLVDFGAARAFTAENLPQFTVIMKSGFAPIEQYSSNGDFGEWTDIYSLGTVLYYALTGKIPPNPYERIASGEDFDFDGKNMNPEIIGIIKKASGISPEERYEHASEIKNDIAALKIKREEIPVPNDYNPLKFSVEYNADAARTINKLIKLTIFFTAETAALISAFILGTALNLYKKPDIPVNCSGEIYSETRTEEIMSNVSGVNEDSDADDASISSKPINNDSVLIEFDSSECLYNHFIFGGNIPASYLESFGGDVEITYHFDSIEPESNMYAYGFAPSDNDENYMIKYITGENIFADESGFIDCGCDTGGYSFILSRKGIEALKGNDFGLYTFNLIPKSAELKPGRSMYPVNYHSHISSFAEPIISEEGGKKTAVFDFIGGSEKNYINPDGQSCTPNISKKVFEEIGGNVAVTLELECRNDPGYIPQGGQHFLIFDCCMTPVAIKRFAFCPYADERDEFGNSIISRYDGDFRFPGYMTEFKFVISQKDIEEHMYGGIYLSMFNTVIKSAKLERYEEQLQMEVIYENITA